MIGAQEIVIEAGHTERNYWRDLFRYRERSYFLASRGRFAVAVILLGFPVFAWSADAESGAKHGLDFLVGEHGLDSLSFNGQSLLASPLGGELQPAKSPFRKGVDAVLQTPSSLATRGQGKDAVDLAYPWGSVSCAYAKKGENGIVMRIGVTNLSKDPIPDVSLRFMELTFPSAPEGATLEAGMFGFGFKGNPSRMGMNSLLADPDFVVPIDRVDYGNSTLNFCSDDLECLVGVLYPTNPPATTSYSFLGACRNVEPGTTKTFTVSLRFGPSGSSVRDLSGDVLKRYADKYPFQVKWNDHRPIGAIYLASSGIKVPTNPRRWIVNEGKIDITTDEGKSSFREALLKLADASVNVLEDCHAQGMITWDPEGQEFLGACYYGDPRLTSTLAPEMEFKGSSPSSTVDAYFQRFRAAGLKVGVCIRPQQITMFDGKPAQGVADDEHAAKVLKDKIEYAKKRWGCTLFYIDSTVGKTHLALNPNVFKTVAEAYPDVLLMPENESMRYFAYSAPLNSYVHHKITSTPIGARSVYPKAFSVLLAPEGYRPEDNDALVEAVRNGDILIFNSWYQNPGITKVKEIYGEAAVAKATATPQRGSP